MSPSGRALDYKKEPLDLHFIEGTFQSAIDSSTTKIDTLHHIFPTGPQNLVVIVYWLVHCVVAAITHNLGQNMLRQIVNSYRNQQKFISQSHIFMLKEPKTLHLPL